MNITLSELGNVLKDKKQNSGDYSFYGQVTSVITDSSNNVIAYNVTVGDSVIEARKLAGANLNDIVLCTTLDNGLTVVTGRLDGDADAMKAKEDAEEALDTVTGLEDRVETIEEEIEDLDGAKVVDTYTEYNISTSWQNFVQYTGYTWTSERDTNYHVPWESDGYTWKRTVIVYDDGTSETVGEMYATTEQVTQSTGHVVQNSSNGVQIQYEDSLGQILWASLYNSFGMVFKYLGTILLSITTSAITFFNRNGKKLMELATGALKFFDGVDNTAPLAEFGGDGVFIGKKSEQHLSLTEDSLAGYANSTEQYLDIRNTATDITETQTDSLDISFNLPANSTSTYYSVYLNNEFVNVGTSVNYVFNLSPNSTGTPYISLGVILKKGRAEDISRPVTATSAFPASFTFKLGYDGFNKLTYIELQNDTGTNIGDVYVTMEHTYTYRIKSIPSAFIGKRCSAGDYAFATGFTNTASGKYSRAGGINSTASGDISVAEGNNCIASYTRANAEGCTTVAGGWAAHAEGCNTQALRRGHSQNGYTRANGNDSFAANRGTIASGTAQTVFGRFNVEDTNDEYALIVGGGNFNSPDSSLGIDGADSDVATADWDSMPHRVTRKDILNLDWDGKLTLAGHSSPIGTVITKTVSANRGSGTDLGNLSDAYIDVPAGSWVITLECDGDLDSANKRLQFMLYNSTDGTDYTSTKVTLHTSNTGAIAGQTTLLINISAQKRFYCRCYQNSGATVSLNARFRAMRIA